MRQPHFCLSSGFVKVCLIVEIALTYAFVVLVRGGDRSAMPLSDNSCSSIVIVSSTLGLTVGRDHRVSAL